MPTIGVCLSGSGVYDGAEIYESVATLYHLEQAGAQYLALAPDINQAHVINHATGEEMPGETRNVMVEAARIVRGQINDIAKFGADDMDALIFPGGFGAAKNLSTYAFDGAGCTVNPEVQRLVREMLAAHKPIGAICIAPAMLAKVLEGSGVHTRLTIGNDPQTARDIEQMGTSHVDCGVTSHIVDRDNKIVSTPAYMLADRIGEAWAGIEGLVKEVLELIES